VPSLAESLREVATTVNEVATTVNNAAAAGWTIEARRGREHAGAHGIRISIDVLQAKDTTRVGKRVKR